MSQLPREGFPAWLVDSPDGGPAWTMPRASTHNPRVKVDRSWQDENRADWRQRNDRSRAPAEVPVSDWTGPVKTGPGPA
jgi:hypothetical protein